MAWIAGCYVDWRSTHPEMVHKFVNNCTRDHLTHPPTTATYNK